MRCHCLRIQTNVLRGLPSGSEVRPENPDPEDRGGAHDPMRDDAMDGEALAVPRVPNLPLNTQCTEAGVAVALRRRVKRIRIPHERKESCQKMNVTEKMCCRSCVSSVGTVQQYAWERQLLTGRVRQTTRVHF